MEQDVTFINSSLRINGAYRICDLDYCDKKEIIDKHVLQISEAFFNDCTILQELQEAALETDTGETDAIRNVVTEHFLMTLKAIFVDLESISSNNVSLSLLFSWFKSLKIEMNWHVLHSSMISSSFEQSFLVY